MVEGCSPTAAATRGSGSSWLAFSALKMSAVACSKRDQMMRSRGKCSASSVSLLPSTFACMETCTMLTRGRSQMMRSRGTCSANSVSLLPSTFARRKARYERSAVTLILRC